MNRWNPLPQNQKDEIVRLYLEGASPRKLAEQFNCARATITRLLKNENIEMRTNGRKFFTNQEEIDEVIRMYREHNSQAAIARHFDVSQSIISRVLNLADEPMNHGQWQRGEKNFRWKGGKVKSDSGYFAIKITDPEERKNLNSMMNRQGYIPEHRLVMARHLGRALSKDETVHHINGNREDNRLENLQIVKRGYHTPGQVVVCYDCGSHNTGPDKFEVESGNVE